jgi:hypothetical protein
MLCGAIDENEDEDDDVYPIQKGKLFIQPLSNVLSLLRPRDAAVEF